MADSRPLIAVDIGNSSTKLGLFAGDVSPAALPRPEWARYADDLAELERSLPQAPLRWRVGSVNREAERRLQSWVSAVRPQDEYRLLTFRDLPIAVCADAPDRVGLDRLAACVAVNVLRQQDRPAAVVDAGSAVTVDLVSSDGAFAGGVILPGFRMSARALSTADLLPEVLFQSSGEPPPVLGKNTEAAIRSGLFWGTVGAVREILSGYAKAHPNLQVFITGGDLQRLAPLVSGESHFVPHLVLAGIALSVRGE